MPIGLEKTLNSSIILPLQIEAIYLKLNLTQILTLYETFHLLY